MVGNPGADPGVSALQTRRITVFLAPVRNPGAEPGFSCLPDRRIAVFLVPASRDPAELNRVSPGSGPGRLPSSSIPLWHHRSARTTVGTATRLGVPGEDAQEYP